MPLDLGALAHNRVAQVGAVAAVGLGGYALYKRRQANAGSATVASDAAGASPGNPAALNTVGTDVATQLGQFGAAQQQALDQFAGQLTQSLDGLQVVQTPGPTSTQPGGAPIQRSTGNRAQSFQQFAGTAGISTQALLALNPGLSAKTSVAPHTTLIVGYK